VCASAFLLFEKSFWDAASGATAEKTAKKPIGGAGFRCRKFCSYFKHVAQKTKKLLVNKDIFLVK